MQRKTPQPTDPLDLAELYRRYYSQKERASMDAEDFAGPGRSFPIKTQQDVHNAARLIGHADDPEAVKANIKAIAKRRGFTLPKAWQDEEDAKAADARADQPTEHEGGHADTAGDAVGEVDDVLCEDMGDDENEDGEDLMDDLDGVDSEDADEPRKAELASILRSLSAQEDLHYYAPITRINRAKREVIGVATAERKDAYRTVIGYEASKDAFGRWPGNIREMHQSKAVGRALEITPDDEHKRIIVRARISKGAQDTWQKVLDGTLTGFSIGGKNGQWTSRLIDGEELPYLERYDAVELSLVDNPACPGCNFELARADGVASDILAKDEEMELPKKVAPAATKSPDHSGGHIERAGARLSQETRDAMHQVRDHALHAATSSMQTCGCDDCTDMLNKVNKTDDHDGDMDANSLAHPQSRRIIADIVRSEIGAALREQVAPLSARVHALLAADAQHDDEPEMRAIQPEITRAFSDLAEQLAALKALVEKIAAQPTDGGPVLHGQALPVEKSLATDPRRSTRAIDSEAIQRAMELGFRPPSDPQEQFKAAAALVRPLR